MHVERLEELEALLLEDANTPTGAMFDLGCWSKPLGGEAYDPEVVGLPAVASIYNNAPKAKLDQDKMPKMTCGTVGCALGLAMLSRRFEKWGLKGTYYRRACGDVVLIPECNEETEFEAGAELFDISAEDSRYLFDPACYDGTPKEAEGERFVAARIRAFINGDIDQMYHPDYSGENDCDEDDED